MSEPTITQADRERAASIAVLQEMRDLILAGRADHHAEPFARWREADIAEGMEIMREAAIERLKFMSCTCFRKLRALDPAAILAAHTRAKALSELAEADADLL